MPSTTNGSFSSSNNLNIGVNLSGAGGYVLGIKSSNPNNDGTKLFNTQDNTKYFSSISAPTSLSDFSASTAAGASYNNKWGYLPSMYNSSPNTDYRPAPSTTGDILDSTFGTDESNTYTISIGARANINTTIGSYNNTFIITAVANQSCNLAAVSINEALCMQDFNNTAQVVLNGKTTTYRDAIIESMEVDRQYQLKDNRDWKTYYIAKMKDGRVWMTQNLDLDITIPYLYNSNTGLYDIENSDYVALTSENTDLTTPYTTDGVTLLNGYSTNNGTITWVPATTAATLASSDYASFATSSTVPYSYDQDGVYYYVDTSGNATTYTSTSDCEAAHNDGTCAHYHVGNYYNWSASVAMNDTSASVDGNYTTNYFSMPNSICPAGWRLPKGKTSGSVSTEYYPETAYTWFAEGITTDIAASGYYSADGWTRIRNAPLYMVASGYRSNREETYSGGTRGGYVTSVVSGSSSFYWPYFAESGPTIPSSGGGARSRGVSIRCVAKQNNSGTTTITFDANDSSTIGTATGSTGTNNHQTVPASTLTTLASNGFAISGYVFNSWNTESDGSGIKYTDAAQFAAIAGPENHNVTLYAQWDRIYTITYLGNGGAGSSYTQEIAGFGYLKGNHFSYTNKYFKGWTTTNGGNTVNYHAGELFIPTSDLTLYAVWGTSGNLYDAVSSLAKGTQTTSDLKTALTTDNSGVFTYDSTEFGVSSDDSNDYNIYYYRGVLDDDLDGTTSTYGTNGNSAFYPNYVKLTDKDSGVVTCWRIVRTTGSGGVKIIYNGLFGATTANSCANATENTHVINSSYTGSSNGYTSIPSNNLSSIGWTYNPSVTGVTSETAVGTVFGRNSNYSVNSADSVIKQYLENTWFPNVDSYLSMLEPGAGFCNDRIPHLNYNVSRPLSDDDTLIPYGTSGLQVYGFSGYVHETPSLTCPASRNIVDLYTTSSASNGNKQLNYPVALITVDEAVLAGSGQNNAYHYNSYLRSGTTFWFLSPSARNSEGTTYQFDMHVNGYVYGGNYAHNSRGVRPMMSLRHNTTISSGSGTATNPWVINAP